MSEAILSLSPTLQWREVEGEIVALHAERSVYLAANSSGALMWRRLSDGATREQLITALVDKYAIERATAEHDVGVFLDELQAQAGLQVSDAK